MKLFSETPITVGAFIAACVLSADIGGVVWEQLRALTARDAYAISNAYTARAQLQAITLHKDRGEVQRVKVGM